jgi:hypothetical protein
VLDGEMMMMMGNCCFNRGVLIPATTKMNNCKIGSGRKEKEKGKR